MSKTAKRWRRIAMPWFPNTPGGIMASIEEVPFVDVWFLAPGLPPAGPGSYWETLSDHERDRARAFRFHRDRDRFIASHGFLREVLARYCECAPEVLVFAEGPYGKPSLVGAPRNIAFNLSHSGGSTLVGVTRGPSCGVDIEALRYDASVSEIAARFFSPEESQRLDALSADEKLPEFFRIWTIKEALIKAAGWGLSLPLQEVRTAGEACRSAVRIRVGDEDRNFWYSSISLAPGFRAAVAVEGGANRVALFRKDT